MLCFGDLMIFLRFCCLLNLVLMCFLSILEIRFVVLLCVVGMIFSVLIVFLCIVCVRYVLGCSGDLSLCETILQSEFMWGSLIFPDQNRTTISQCVPTTQCIPNVLWIYKTLISHVLYILWYILMVFNLIIGV